MPIQGLTDRRAALPRIGIIRKGGPKTGNRPGPDLSYFRFVTEFPEIDAKFRAAYKEQPKLLNVFFLFNEVDDVLEAWREHWVAGGLQHRCDGETCSLWLDPKTNEYRTDPKPCPDVGKPKRQKRCKPVGRLMVVIPELEHIATVTVLTTSEHDIRSLTQSLIAAKWVNRDRQFPDGRLAGVPFTLTRREMEISTPRDEGKRARVKKSLLFIEPAHHYAVAQLNAMDITPLLLPPAQAAVPAPCDMDDEDEDIDTETGEIVAPSENHGRAVEEVKPPEAQAELKPAETGIKYVWPEIEQFPNVGAFYAWCNKYFHVTTTIVNKNLNIKGPSELVDLKQAAETIRGIFGMKPPEEELPFSEPTMAEEPDYTEEEPA